MAGDCVDVRLSELAMDRDRAFAMGPFGSNIRADNYQDSGVPVIRGTNLGKPGEPRFRSDDHVYLSEAKANELISSNAHPNDIVFVAQGTIGKVGIIPRDTGHQRFVLSQNLMKVTVDPDHADPLYVFYFFRSSLGQHEILSRANPTGVPCISKPLTSLREFNVRLPLNVATQKAIACILGALDDKIELNRRMNETLEAMARAIFKSWFVDFAPVVWKAKRAGNPVPARFAKTAERYQNGASCPVPEKIAGLFPDAFEESELGEIPRGWGIRPIGDVVKVLGGGTPRTKEPIYWEGGTYPFCTPKDMSSLLSPMLLGTERHLTDKGLAKVSSGQLPEGTVLLSSRAPIGYLAIAEIPVSVNQGIIAMVCDKELPNLYVLQWAHANMERIIANANGSTFLEISKRNFRPIKALVPPAQILEQFIRLAGPLYQRLVSNLRQVSYLGDIRDSLLPRLISGELRVPDAERVIGRAI